MSATTGSFQQQESEKPKEVPQQPLKLLYDTLNGYADRMTLRFAGPAAVLGGLMAWLLNWGRNPIPFVSDQAGFGVLIFVFSIFTAFVSSALGFVLGVRYRNRLAPPDLRRSWVWSVLPLAVAYAIVVGLFAALALQFVGMVFPNLALQAVYAIVLVGLVCGSVANFVANQSMRVRVRPVLGLFIVTLFGGVAISAIADNNAMWWEQSFSFLGESDARSHIIFNSTMLVSGLLLIVLQQFFMDDFVFLNDIGMLTSREVKLVRLGLVALGLVMMMIGFVPFGINNTLDTVHDMSAYSIAAILLVFMLTARRLLPSLPKEFFAITWLTIGLLIAAVGLHLVGSINTVGVELLAFAIGGSWFVLFIKNVEMLVEQIDPQSFINL